MELAGKRVCIVGCGSVGTECARRFAAFDCPVIGVDVFTQERPHFRQILPLEQLDEALAVADVVVLTLPLTTETRHLMNGTRFGKMKPGAVLVNIARGAVVDTDSLTDALRGNLGGAVLDVFEEEPLDPEHPLWSMENVLLTPHNSFVGDGNQARLCRVIMENLERYQ
jgi:phosphoglycerate dehydrogenase-like enzyme